MGEIREFIYEGPELLAAMEEIRQYESREHKYILNDLRFAQVRKAYESIRAFFEREEQKATVRLKIESMKTVASIWIETDYVAVMDIPGFIEIIRLANNFEVCPSNRGTVHFTATFLDIATEIVPKKPNGKFARLPANQCLKS